MDGVKKIVVLRALVLGDMVFILPALDALHKTYPQAEITLITRPWAVEFLSGRLPGVQHVIGIRSAPEDFEDLGFLIHPQDAQWFFPQMRAEGFDLAVSMQGGGINANPFLKRLGAQVNIGTREAGAIPLDRWLLYDYYQNDVIRNLDLAALAGAQAHCWHPCLPVLSSDRAAAEPFLDKIQSPYAVIHSGARDVRRMWPPERFATIADAVKHELGLDIVLTGTNVDAEAAFQVEDAMRERAINLSHQLSLPALVGVLSGAHLIISNDTGVLHVGLAVGSKAVGLYWGEYISKSMPLSRCCFHPVIGWERRCPLCDDFLDREEVVRTDPRPCMHQVSFIDSITPEQVFSAAQTLLAHK